MKNDRIEVLDKGYVRLVNSMGTDIDVVNAARVSYAKESSEFKDRDERLIKFLWNSQPRHTSPFRHQVMTFEVYAPLMVARQWFKYSVASAHLDDQQGWNESSRRYVTEEPTFYIPSKTEWRSTPANSKQGSGEPIDARAGLIATEQLMNYIDEGNRLYDYWMKMGVCAEQARLFLPSYGMYVRWRWTTSLAGVLHFLEERLEHDAQKEIVEYARALKKLVEPLFPVTFKTIFSNSMEER